MSRLLNFRRNAFLGSGKGNTLHRFVQNLNEENRKRVDNYKQLWDFYEGRQWAGQDELSLEKRTMMLNYCRAIVNYKAKFLVKNSVDIQLVDNPETTESEIVKKSYIKQFLELQWERNNKDIFLLNMAISGGVQGDVFIRPSFGYDEEFGEQYAKLSILPPHYVFPVYGDMEAEHLDKNIMTACHLIYPVLEREYAETRLYNFNESQKDYSNTYVWYRETWTKDEYLLYKDEDLIESEPNIYGEIPIVHIKNLPSVNSEYGISDLADIVPLQRSMNEVATEIQEIIHYYASPITVIKGARIDNLERGGGKIWAINSKDVDIANLKMDDDLKASQDFFRLVYESMLQLSSIPEQAINPTKNVSNTPGVALHMAFQPLIEERKIKELTYGRGIKKINRLMLKLMSRIDSRLSRDLDAVGKYAYSTKLGFGPPLARDESLELDKMQTRLDMGITTKKRELVKQGHSEEEAQKIIDEAREDKRIELEITNLVNNQVDEDTKLSQREKISPFGKRRRPDPVTQGDIVSTNTGEK